MFNETPVVGGPLGFVAVSWHGRSALGVGGWAEPAGSWHHRRSLLLPTSQGWPRFTELRVCRASNHACSHVIRLADCAPALGGRCFHPTEEEDLGPPGTCPTKHWAGCWVSLPHPTSAPSVQMRKLRPQQVKEFSQVDIATSRTRDTAFRHKPLLNF